MSDTVSIVARVAQAVRGLGRATIDDLQPRFPELRREQLQKALQNAAHQGFIQIEVRGVGGHKPVQAVWGPAEPKAVTAAAAPGRRVSSVWDLAAQLEHTNTNQPEAT